MTDNSPRILVIEDEQKVALSLQKGLNEAGFTVFHASNGEEGIVLWLEQQPEALILDLNLPGRDGLEILDTIRKQDRKVPVLILSARDTIDDRVTGLDHGADDYLVKPFAFQELLARLRVMLRRDQSTVLNYQLADLEMDAISRTVTRGNTAINLTAREYEILELLLRNAHRPVSRQIIAKDIWKVQRATSLDNVIDVHVMRLRKKIDEDSGSRLIHTIRGLGYVITDQPDQLP